MSDEQKQPPTSATIKVLEGTVKTMKITDNAALGMGAIENVLPGVTKAAAATLSESAPIIGPIAGKTVGFLGRWGGRVAVPLQLVVGTGEAIYHGVKGQYEDMGGDIGGTVGGIGGGIAVGAAIGSVVPGVGTVIGGAIGGVIGYFGGEKAGRAIAGHFVASAAAAKSDKQAAADLHTVFEKQAKQPFHFAGDPETPPAPPPAKTPAGAPQNAFTKVAQANVAPPAVDGQVETPPPDAAPVTTPVAAQTGQPGGNENSLGVLLDKSSGMHGSELTNVFQRVTKFADDNHVSLGTKFSLASMAVSVLSFLNFGGWANGLIESMQHFALDAMKDDLINQGPNLAGSSDTRPHQPVAGAPAPALAPAV